VLTGHWSTSRGDLAEEKGELSCPRDKELVSIRWKGKGKNGDIHKAIVYTPSPGHAIDIGI